MNEDIEPMNGDMREVEKFLLFPRRINGKFKWLTKVYAVQFYWAFEVNGMFLDTYKVGGWNDIQYSQSPIQSPTTRGVS